MQDDHDDATLNAILSNLQSLEIWVYCVFILLKDCEETRQRRADGRL